MNRDVIRYGVEVYLEDGKVKTKHRKMSMKEIVNSEIHHYKVSVRNDDLVNQKTLLTGIIKYMMIKIMQDHCLQI